LCKGIFKEKGGGRPILAPFARVKAEDKSKAAPKKAS
jgi:hypothetical protein